MKTSGGSRGHVRLLRWVVVTMVIGVVAGFAGLWPTEASAARVSPAALTFQAVQGGAVPAAQTLTVTRSNFRAVNWTGAGNAAWLTLSPAGGRVTSSLKVAVSVNPTGLAAGTYNGMVTITLGKSSTLVVPVTLTVTAATSSGGGTAATTALLTWNPNVDTDLAGYKVYMGTTSGQAGSPIDVGKATSYSAVNLTTGRTYYFTVTAYDTSGNESAHSAEVSKSIY